LLECPVGGWIGWALGAQVSIFVAFIVSMVGTGLGLLFRADAVGLLAERALAAGFGDRTPLSYSRAQRYQAVLHVEAATLKEEAEPGLSKLEDGTRVSAETARRIACDASLV
jgi:hypothetical protein